jgi:uncharacterized protein (TIGR00296 family)
VKEMAITDEDGKLLVELARKSMEEYVRKKTKYFIPKDLAIRFSEKMGVFVTINRIKGKEKMLRGCIGYPLPFHPLAEAVVEAAISSAINDPRFDPIRKDELNEVLIEVSVLTPPKLIEVNTPMEYPQKIKIGEDGLILEWRLGSGLLLPQVPVELNWDVNEYLENLCLKAGITPDYWLRKDVKIYKFQAMIWEEKSRKEIVRKRLQ